MKFLLRSALLICAALSGCAQQLPHPGTVPSGSAATEKKPSQPSPQVEASSRPKSQEEKSAASPASVSAVEPAADGLEEAVQSAAKNLPSIRLFPKPFPTGVLSMQTRSMVNGARNGMPQLSKRRYFPAANPLYSLYVDTVRSDETRKSGPSGAERQWNSLISSNQLLVFANPEGPGKTNIGMQIDLIQLKVLENRWLPLRKGSRLRIKTTHRSSPPQQASYDSEETTRCEARETVPAATIYAAWSGDAMSITCDTDSGQSNRKSLYYYFAGNGLLWLARHEQNVGKTQVVWEFSLLDAHLDMPNTTKKASKPSRRKKKS